jgi:hypothetical protein
VRILGRVVIRKATDGNPRRSRESLSKRVHGDARPTLKKSSKKSSFFKKIICKSLSMSCLNVKLTVSFSSFSECGRREAMKKVKVANGGTTVGFCERKPGPGPSDFGAFLRYLELIGTNWSYLEGDAQSVSTSKSEKRAYVFQIRVQKFQLFLTAIDRVVLSSFSMSSCCRARAPSRHQISFSSNCFRLSCCARILHEGQSGDVSFGLRFNDGRSAY